MTPGARVRAAIELLDQIIDAARGGGAAADTLVARYFATRRYAGSKDRRAVRELVYAAIRRAGEMPASGRAAMTGLVRDDPALAAAFDGSAHGPRPIDDEAPAAAGIAPDWLERRLAASGIDGVEASTLVGRAPLDLRENRLAAGYGTFDHAGAQRIPHVPAGWRLPPGTAVEASDAFRTGLVEVQDAGSQLVTLASGAAPGMTVIDLCAGAGGKALALAAMMDNRGSILATDTDRGRLSRLAPRAARAGAAIIAARLLDPGREAMVLDDWRGSADIVLIDAPCSGTGTWRRNPEARWRLSPARIDRLVGTQARLLRIGADLVRPGGALVYIVCSLLDEEGAAQVAALIDEQPRWTPEMTMATGRSRGAGVRLTPAHDDTDGFFVARLVRRC
ncbi:RsmB/NOP family class I SAM-dependent RNA methyltransferase [uncultured Sphingomonas sp.]|uniref:RsmB/NOP family class I SAM-dependent RNA methyltransferase n=1 Tax=uncultured Sphingomonas sp. TaxID=158754 RepID=UPI0035CBA4EA